MAAAKTILLFISRESATYQFTKRQVEMACDQALGASAPAIKVIDIADNPDLAEKYNIEALPTLIVGDKRYIGAPSQDLLNTCLGLAPNDVGK
jgi:protein-disulfide isomerase